MDAMVPETWLPTWTSSTGFTVPVSVTVAVMSAYRAGRVMYWTLRWRVPARWSATIPPPTRTPRRRTRAPRQRVRPDRIRAILLAGSEDRHPGRMTEGHEGRLVVVHGARGVHLGLDRLDARCEDLDDRGHARPV